MSLDVSRLARDHYDDVFRFCARRVGADGAADVAQETFITAQRTAGRFRGESLATTWLFGIAFNECRRFIRRRKLEPPPILFEPSGPSHEAGSIDRQALSEAIRKLSDDHREALIMHEIEGMTYAEIATVIGIPEGTVKSRIHHALARLREALEPWLADLTGEETK